MPSLQQQKMTHCQFFTFLLLVSVYGSFGGEYTITPINSSSGLYYEQIGEVLLSNNKWEFVTYIDYGDYLIFYQYIHQQAEKLRDFCNEFKLKIPDSNDCETKLSQVESSMQIVMERHESMSNYLGLTTKTRKKRFWQAAAAVAAPYILQPLGEGLARFLFGNNDRQNFEEYDRQIAELHNSQNAIMNEVQNQRTIFKIDSEIKSKQIDYLKRAKDRIEDQLKIVKETIRQDNLDKEKKIKDLNNLLDITQAQLKKQEKIDEEHSKDIKGIKNTIQRLDSYMKDLDDQVNSNTERINDSDIRIKLNSATLDFLFLWSIFQVQQGKLFKGIVNSNNGHFDPYVLTPLKLVDILQKAMGYLPEGLKFPVHPNFENAMELYNLMEPVVYFYNYTIVFKLNIKLVNSVNYYLYRIHSLPTAVSKDTFTFIVPNKPYLLIDEYHQQYALISQERFERCERLHNSKFICKETSQFVSKSILGCEVNLFLYDEISKKCNIFEIRPVRPFVLQLTKRTSWLYVVPNTNKLMVKCGDNRKSISISRSGFLDTGICLAWLNGTLLSHASVPHDIHIQVLNGYFPNVKIDTSTKNSKMVSVELQHVILPYDFDELKKELEDSSVSLSGKYKPREEYSPEGDKTDNKKEDMIHITVIIAVATITIILIGLIVFVNRIFHCNVQNNQSMNDTCKLKR